MIEFQIENFNEKQIKKKKLYKPQKNKLFENQIK